MKAGTTESMKFMVLKAQLRVSKYAAIGILEGLWALTATSASDGAIGKFSNIEIASWMEWDGDADELIDALIKARFVDECAENRLVIHDWAEHAPTYIKGNLSKHGKEFAVAKQTSSGASNPAKHKSWGVIRHQEEWDSLRRKIFDRDQGQCVYCGKPATQIDHKIPKARGGDNSEENLAASCASCNASKCEMTDSEFIAYRAKQQSEPAKQALSTGEQAATKSSQAKSSQTNPSEDLETAQPRKRGSRLPSDWTLPANLAAWAKAERPDLDIRMEADRFRDYWTAKPGKDGTKLDWDATWRNWIRNAKNLPRAGPQRPSAHGGFEQIDYSAGINPDGSF